MRVPQRLTDGLSSVGIPQSHVFRGGGQQLAIRREDAVVQCALVTERRGNGLTCLPVPKEGGQIVGDGRKAAAVRRPGGDKWQFLSLVSLSWRDERNPGPRVG